MSNSDLDYFDAQATDSYYLVNAGRAAGTLPEKESTKAAARLARENSPAATTFLDAGCSAGHLLQSLRNAGIHVQRYVGIDLDEPAIAAARRTYDEALPETAEFRVASVSDIPLPDNAVEVSISLNVLEHMRGVRPTLDELIRVTSDLVIIRTSVRDSTYIIQEVRNSSDWSGPNATYAALPPPEDELSEDGAPKQFVYQNMWGRAYLQAQIQRIDPTAHVVVEADRLFSANAIQADNEATGLPQAAEAKDFQQIVGPLILPHCWVLIGLQGQSLTVPDSLE